MIELGRHIEVLLLKSDCVIVPGLGGFVANHVAARYDESDNTFIPPLRTLGFNPKLILNDSLLAQSYSDTYDISYPEACNRIEKEVEELKLHLENNGYYEFGDVGTLSMNSNGSIEFTPCEAGILTPELYSLSSFEMKKNDEEEARTARKKRKQAAATVTVNVNTDNNIPFDESGQVIEAEENAGSERKIQIRVSAVRNLVAATVAIILFLAIGTPLNEGCGTMRTSNLNSGMVQKVITDGYNNIIGEKSASLNAKDAVKRIETVKTKPAAEPKTIETAVKEPAKDYYCIVLASRVTKKNADIFVEQLGKQGFAEASVLVDKNKSIKVIYGHYENQNEAYNALNNLRGNDNFVEAWVYQVKI